MKRNVCLGLIALWLAALAASGAAVDMRGTVGAAIDLLPTLAGRALLNLTASGEAWTLSSDTTLNLFPAFGVRETVSLVYTAGPAELTAQASVDLIPWAFNYAKLMGTLDLFSTDLRDAAPEASLGASFTAGVDLLDELNPFAQFVARANISYEELTVRHTTTLSLLPLGLTSQLVASLTLGNITLISTTTWSYPPSSLASTLLARIQFEGGALDHAHEGAATVSASAELLQSIIPFAFSYARVSATITAEPYSLEGSVTYSGGTEFQLRVTAAAQLERLKLEAWLSYNPTAEAPVGAGVSASLALGPIELWGSED